MAKQSNHDKKKLTREQRDNLILKKVFYLFLAGIAAECYLLVLSKQFINSPAETFIAIYRAMQVLTVVGLAVMVVGIVLLALGKGGEKARKFYPWLIIAGGFFGISSFLMNFLFPKGGTYLCVIVPILTVLGLVYYLFQREFFWVTIILGGGMFTVWVCRKGIGSANWHTRALVGSLLVLAGLVLVTVLTRMIEKNHGKWIGKCHCMLFPANCDYRLFYLAYAIVAVAIVLALVAVTTTYYSLWVLGIALFAYAVYYTTKLM